MYFILFHLFRGILEWGMKWMSLLYKSEFCDFKLAKEEDARNHFKKFFSLFLVFYPASYMNHCVNYWKIVPTLKVHSQFLKYLLVLPYSLLLKLNKVHGGILQHDGKQSFGGVHSEAILWTSLVYYICCDREFCIVVEYFNIVYYHASFSAIPVWSLLCSELKKHFYTET